LSTTEEEYLAMLKRVREKLPKVLETSERFVIPDPEVVHEGGYTHILNFKEIADAVDRDPDHIILFLSHELGVPIVKAAKRLILQARVKRRLIEDKIQKYIKNYVICPECGKPDTKLIKQKRYVYLKCEVCGAETPVRKV